MASGAQHWDDRPFGYIVGVAALLVNIVPARTNRMRDAVAATAIGFIALVLNGAIVIWS